MSNLEGIKMAKKRKTLPKDFEELIKTGDIEALKKVYEKCELNAYTGYCKSNALFLNGVPDELVRWLVEQGVDINYRDDYGETALHHRVGRGENVSLLLELGADIEATTRRGDTPLHKAAKRYQAQAVHELISLGARISSTNYENYTPLESALSQCQNANITNMAKVARVFLDAGNPIPTTARELVTAIGERFEFYRDRFNVEYLQETEEALKCLYEMFGVEPVKKIRKHDGVSPIAVTNATWQKQHNELWEYLVPGSGHAHTVQGEVIRITGRISHEVLDNGGINWDHDYRKMLKALIQHLGAGAALNNEDLKKASEAAEALNRGMGDDEPACLCELAVKWVLANPDPIKMEKVDYKR